MCTQQRVTAPEGFPDKPNCEVVLSTQVRLPGESHPHFLVVAEETLNEDIKAALRYTLKLSALAITEIEDPEDRAREQAENDRYKELLEGDVVFTVISFCKPGGDMPLNAFGSFKEAEEEVKTWIRDIANAPARTPIAVGGNIYNA